STFAAMSLRPKQARTTCHAALQESPMASRLNPEQIAFFQTEGYLLYDQPVFHPDKFAALQAHFEHILKAWEAQGKRPEHMDVPHFSDVQLFDWLLDDDVLDIVESLLGPDIALFS